jgi:hypothetical protein
MSNPQEVAKKLIRLSEEILDTSVSLQYEPEVRTPGGFAKDKIIPQLSGKAKEALTKIWNRSTHLREIKEEQLKIQSQLTEIQNQLKETADATNADIQGYLRMADNAFEELNLFERKAYALCDNEGVILAAIEREIKEFPADPKIKTVPKTATTILSTLTTLGLITDEMVKKAEAYIDKMNLDIPVIQKKIVTVYTYPPAKKDKIEAGKRIAFGLNDIIVFLKKSYHVIKDFVMNFVGLNDEFDKALTQLNTAIQ